MPVEFDTTPYWVESTADFPTFPQLDRPESVDVVVIGAGITGLTAAYLLAAAGRSVVVLERRRCVEVDTAHTTAHLTMVTDLNLSDLVSSFGRDHAQAAWDAGLAGIAQIEAIAAREQIDCQFARVPGYQHVAAGYKEKDVDELREQARLADEFGFDAEFLEQTPLMAVPGVRFDHQARFHPRRYLAGLAQAIVRQGGRIYEQSEAGDFAEQERLLKANGHEVRFKSLVLATHTPLMGRASMVSASLFQTKLALYTSYVVAGRVPKGQVPDALFWDTADPYHYLRIEPLDDHDLVIFGGEDHKTGQADDTAACFARLEAKLVSLVPGIAVTNRWSGQVIETPDGLPYIGETAPFQFAGTGYAGNGMTFGSLCGMMACDRILGRTNPWSDLFDPERKSVVSGAWDYLTENKDYPYYLLRDLFAGAKTKSVRGVPAGEGRVVKQDGQQVAVYRDPGGTLSVHSAVCPHMGCLVAWNNAERTWDCPCHGSRFATDGTVIAGPAESPLPAMNAGGTAD
jgi:glycine/D-amino acid oxidase-like deaminating enzyme/nitrite reductase/ring-hydroxylating ferredoxin subunit